MVTIDDAFAAVPERFYTHHDQRGETLHRSDPASIRRELTAAARLPGRPGVRGRDRVRLLKRHGAGFSLVPGSYRVRLDNMLTAINGSLGAILSQLG